ncbi:hypothetical protein HYX58_00805 [Candidatus Dependentiae bacterium]|nr:hypothetical protein [Candidatus Dependentiae bacterium]
MKKLLFQGLIILAGMSSILAMEQPQEQTEEEKLAIKNEYLALYVDLSKAYNELKNPEEPLNFQALEHLQAACDDLEYQVPSPAKELLQEKGFLLEGESSIDPIAAAMMKEAILPNDQGPH